MIFMLVVTMCALVWMFWKSIEAGVWLLVIISAVLFVLAIALVYVAITGLRAAGKRKPAGG
jgi:hypothetical protein